MRVLVCHRKGRGFVPPKDCTPTGWAWPKAICFQQRKQLLANSSEKLPWPQAIPKSSPHSTSIKPIILVNHVVKGFTHYIKCLPNTLGNFLNVGLHHRNKGPYEVELNLGLNPIKLAEYKYLLQILFKCFSLWDPVGTGSRDQGEFLKRRVGILRNEMPAQQDAILSHGSGFY
jgi:hypothetical protein